jgi:hypothetical protein
MRELRPHRREECCQLIRLEAVRVDLLLCGGKAHPQRRIALQPQLVHGIASHGPEHPEPRVHRPRQYRFFTPRFVFQPFRIASSTYA